MRRSSPSDLLLHIECELVKMDDKVFVNILAEDMPSDAQMALWNADSGYRVLIWHMIQPNPSVLDKFNFMIELAENYLLQSDVKTLFVMGNSEYISSDMFKEDFGFKITTDPVDPLVSQAKVFGFGALNPDLTNEIIYRVRTYIESGYILGDSRGQKFIDETMDQIINEYLRTYNFIRI